MAKQIFNFIGNTVGGILLFQELQKGQCYIFDVGLHAVYHWHFGNIMLTRRSISLGNVSVCYSAFGKII
jgi:hypothetical protein